MKIYVKVVKAAVLFIMLTFLWACTTVPVTGRKQLVLIPALTMHEISFQQYSEFLRNNPTVSKGSDLEMVRRVGRRIQNGVEIYFAEKGLSGFLDKYRWEFNLVDNKMVNAWCMPGGKVVVYTGLLPVAMDEEGLAVVMGHEIAHAIARHGAERMSQQMALKMGGMALSRALEEKPKETQVLWSSVYGLGAQFGFVLPYSRMHESEADHMGLIFMALAGYNPEAAVPFWERMSLAGGQKPPEFMSTHPSDATRIADIQKWMPEALKYYRVQ